MSPPLPPPTHEELVAERARQQRNLRWGAVVLGVCGALVALAGATAVALGHTPMLLASGIVAMVLAGVTGARARVHGATPLPDAPRLADLPADDPRKAVPRATRRRIWLLAALGWLGTLVAAGAGVWALGPHSPAIFKLVLFLGAPALALALGARVVRRRNGTTRWPD